MKVKKSKPVKIIFIFLFAAYVLLLIYLTFFSSYFGRGTVYRNINLIPFKTILQYLVRDRDIRNMLINIAGNIAVFMPMGFLLPIVFKPFNRFGSIFAAIFSATFLIEAAQYFFAAGSSDIDDILLNLMGGFIGLFIYKAMYLYRYKKI